MSSKRMKLIRDSTAYAGPSQNAGELIRFAAGTVFEAVPDSSMPDDRFFRFYYGDRSGYILSEDAVPVGSKAEEGTKLSDGEDKGAPTAPGSTKRSVDVPGILVAVILVGGGAALLVGASGGDCSDAEVVYCDFAAGGFVLVGLVVIFLGLVVFAWSFRGRGVGSGRAEAPPDTAKAWDFKHLGREYFKEVIDALPKDFSPVIVWTSRTTVAYTRSGVRPFWVVESQSGERVTDPRWKSDVRLEEGDALRWEFEEIRDEFDL